VCSFALHRPRAGLGERFESDEELIAALKARMKPRDADA
jgi:hypothetical protein